MDNYTRAHLHLLSASDCEKFVRLLNGDSTTNKYILETADGGYRVSARSFLGVAYFAAEHYDETYLVNMTEDGVYPNGIDDFRI